MQAHQLESNLKLYFICSEQIQNLQKEVSNLKRELQNKNPGASFVINPVPQGTETRDPQQQQQYGGYYYYPYTQGQYPAGYDRRGSVDQIDSAPTAVHTASGHPSAYYDPFYGNMPSHPAVIQPSPHTMPNLPYPSNDHRINTAPQDHYSAHVDFVHGEPYQDTYATDVNQNYQPFYGDDTDSGDQSSPHRASELRNYYIPSKYRTSSPSRRRSRRDNYEHERGRNEYSRNRSSSPYRETYSSQERYSSPNRCSVCKNHGRVQAYRSPERAYPNSSVQHPLQNYTVPPPPTYGSQQHYAASHPVEGHSHYYQAYPQGTHTLPASNVAGHATESMVGMHPQVQFQSAAPIALQRSMSVPIATVPTARDKYVSILCIIDSISGTINAFI